MIIKNPLPKWKLPISKRNRRITIDYLKGKTIVNLAKEVGISYSRIYSIVYNVCIKASYIIYRNYPKIYAKMREESKYENIIAKHSISTLTFRYEAKALIKAMNDIKEKENGK